MTSSTAQPGRAHGLPGARQLGPGPGTSDGGTSIVDLLDRVVQSGVVVTGDLIISLAGVDLIRLDLRLLLSGVSGALAGVPGRPGEKR